MTIEIARPEWNYLSHDLLIDPGVVVQQFFVLSVHTFLTFPQYEPYHEKTNNVVSEQVRRKPSCTHTEVGYRGWQFCI